MGGGNVKNYLNKSELKDFHNMSSFCHETIISLHQQFMSFSSIINDDGLIDYGEFCVIIGKEDNVLTRRIFDTIDLNKDKKINFREFLKFISCFLTGCEEEQKSLSFRLFSDPESNVIRREVMMQMLKEIFSTEGTLFEYLDEDILNEIIEDTFKSAGSNGEGEEGDNISYETYKAILDKNPNILKWLKVDIQKIEKNKRTKRDGCLI